MYRGSKCIAVVNVSRSISDRLVICPRRIAVACCHLSSFLAACILANYRGDQCRVGGGPGGHPSAVNAARVTSTCLFLAYCFSMTPSQSLRHQLLNVILDRLAAASGCSLINTRWHRSRTAMAVAQIKSCAIAYGPSNRINEPRSGTAVP
jgi:hypothetical protein